MYMHHIHVGGLDVCTYIYDHTYTCMMHIYVMYHMHICIHAYVCSAYMYAYMSYIYVIYMLQCMYICIYTYIHMHIYMHIHSEMAIVKHEHSWNTLQRTKSKER